MDARLSNIIALCLTSDRGRGIWQRIDENRAILELVHRETFVGGRRQSGPPLEVWLASNDIFFVSVVNALGLRKPGWIGKFFPRPWTGTMSLKESYRIFASTIEEDIYRFSSVVSVCTECDAGRGIWKRIDENRALLQFFYREWHQVLQDNPSVECWIENQDVFLNNIARALALVKPAWLGGFFPRLWPGTIEIERYYNDYPPTIPA
jgi:hypothetical protein